MVHDQHVFTHDMYLPFCFYALPRASYGYIQCGFIPSAVWRFSKFFIHFCASVCFWRLCMLWGVVMGSPLCWDTSLTSPLFGGASPLITAPTLSCWFPVHWYVSGISVCYVGIFLLLKGLGVWMKISPLHLRLPFYKNKSLFLTK